MKPLFSLLILLALTACQTAETTQPKPAPVKQDFLTTGRGLSNGAVDLYQPGTDFLPTAEYPTTGRALSPIPGNPNVLVNDPSVTIYSLDTMEVNEVQAAPLPPLQPPTSLQGGFPSPFDSNGNPVK
ncbi:MAG: hypothetical protein DI586_02295 [Micavibrio aeruginosavorus]|uniref:Lipoprotein n=1 Tax=Micavibrio aeruginosavorus TaxID=349221 RepID=A0A2W5FR20_9BACT|nr:MAG: hypothetical protein DI586_02295 [Micavibrio aeruginosavorus]